MRRQNPPQSFLDQALALESWLNPAPLGVAYVVCATAGFAFITLLFATLASVNLLSPAGIAAMLLVMLGSCALALLEYCTRPKDMLSLLIRRLVDSRRQPVHVVIAQSCAFKVLLRTGETLCVDLAFYCPPKNQSPELREYIMAHARLALERDCFLRDDPPTRTEVLDAVDHALDGVASEFSIPVLYSEIRDLQKISDAYSKPDDDLTSSEYLGLVAGSRMATGTLG